MEDKRWRNEALRIIEEGLPRLKEEFGEQRGDFRPPQVRDVTVFSLRFRWTHQQKRGEIVKLSEKVEQ